MSPELQSGSTVEGAYYYDGLSRLVQRVQTNVSPAVTTQYLYDEADHVVVETDGNGNSLREYIWLDDMPVAIIDQVNTTSPVRYYVLTDHLDRADTGHQQHGRRCLERDLDAVWRALLDHRLADLQRPLSRVMVPDRERVELELE